MTVMKATDLLRAKDTHTNRPAANAVPKGALYPCSTHNVVYQSDGSAWQDWNPFSATGITIEDENASVATGVTKIDFQGAGVTATAGTGEVVVTIPGGGSSSAWSSKVTDDLSATTNITTQTGTWAINSGVLRQSNTGLAARAKHNTNVAPAGIIAAEVEVAFISGSGTRRIGLIYRYDSGGGEHQIMYLETTDGTTWTLKLERDGAAIIHSVGTVTYAGSGYIKLGIVQTSGDFCDLYIDGVHFKSTDAASITALNFKHVGLYTNSCVADFRNLKVWGLPVPW